MTHTMPADSAMPVLFIGHGSPMNAIEDNKIGLQERDEPLAFACERIVLGSVSMRAVIIGEAAISG